MDYKKGDKAIVKKTGKVITVDAVGEGFVPPIWDKTTGYMPEELEKLPPKGDERARDRRIRRNSREACARLLGTPFDLFNKVEAPKPEHGPLCFCVHCMGEHKLPQYRCESEG